MVAQTANGTVVNGRGGDGDEFRFGMNADGPRWNTDPRPEAPQPDQTIGSAGVVLPRGRVAVSAHTRRKGR
jgi:hypothetical protein